MEPSGDGGSNPRRFYLFTIIIVLLAAVSVAAVASIYYRQVNLDIQRIAENLDTARMNETVKNQEIAVLKKSIGILKEKGIRDKNRDKADEFKKINDLIRQLQPKLDPNISEAIARTALKYSNEFGIPPELIVHIINRESSFRLILVSNKGAKGLMQVLERAHPKKLKNLRITNDSIFYIDNNIHLGSMILSEYFDSKKSISEALQAYVGGNHRTYIDDILIGFTNTMIHQYKKIHLEQDVKPHDKKGEEKEKIVKDKKKSQEPEKIRDKEEVRMEEPKQAEVAAPEPEDKKEDAVKPESKEAGQESEAMND